MNNHSRQPRQLGGSAPTWTTCFEEFQDECGPQTLEEAVNVIDGLQGTDQSTRPYGVERIEVGQGPPLICVIREGHDTTLVLKSEKALDYYRDWLGRRWLHKDEMWEEGRERLRNENRRDRDIW